MKPDRILLTGSTGMLGRHASRALRDAYGEECVIGVSRADFDLMDPRSVDRLLETTRPDVVVHFAGYSGGIGANRIYPADFYYRNTLLTALMFESAARHGVKRLIYPMGGCSYPADATSPIDEDQLWRGFPQAESAAYSTAKMMGTVASAAYRQQFGLDSTVLIPGNLYGEYDNFHPLYSHVIPAMIRRYYEAELAGENKVVMWGTGRPERDFVYAGDVGATIPYFVEAEELSGPINISSGVRTSIRELAESIAEVVEFHGAIDWDRAKPDGQMVKVFDVRRLRALGLSCATSLRDGLERTIRWFAANYATRGDGLRL